MSKIGRNDPCPCGSGKKYKHCHLVGDPKELQALTEPKESVVLEDVMKDPLFEKYYREYRPQIKEDIHWKQDSSLPSGVDFRRTVTGSGETQIRLRRFPPPKSDAQKIAHEMHHIVIEKMQFPDVVYKEAIYENLSSAIGSMLHDLTIEHFQKDFGFDIEHEYYEENKDALRQLRQEKHEPTDNLNRCLWTVNICGRILSWDVIFGSPLDENELIVWLRAHFPGITREAEGLAMRIGDRHNDPTSMTAVFVEIIEKFGLLGKVFVKVNTQQAEGKTT